MSGGWGSRTSLQVALEEEITPRDPGRVHMGPGGYRDLSKPTVLSCVVQQFPETVSPIAEAGHQFAMWPMTLNS